MTGDLLLRFSGNDKPEIFFQADSDLECKRLREWLSENFNLQVVNDLNGGAPRTSSRLHPLSGSDENGKEQFS